MVLGQARRAAVLRNGTAFNDPLQAVTRLFCRSDWGAENDDELPRIFVSALFEIQADLTSTVEFQIDNYRMGYRFCFGNATLTNVAFVRSEI